MKLYYALVSVILLEGTYGSLRKTPNMDMTYTQNGQIHKMPMQDNWKGEEPVDWSVSEDKRKLIMSGPSKISYDFNYKVTPNSVIQYIKDSKQMESSPSMLCLKYKDETALCHEHSQGKMQETWKVGLEKIGDTTGLIMTSRKGDSVIGDLKVHETMNANLFGGCMVKKNTKTKLLKISKTFDSCRAQCTEDDYDLFSFYPESKECQCVTQKQNKRVNLFLSQHQSKECDCVKQSTSSGSMCVYHVQQHDSHKSMKLAKPEIALGDSLKERDDVVEESDHFNKAPKVIGVEEVHDRKPQKVSPLKRSNQQVPNFNNIITNVCHSESGDAQDLRRSLVARTGARPTSRGGRGSSSRSGAGSDICEHSSTLLAGAAITAAPLGLLAAPGPGVAAATAIGAATLITSMACPSDEGSDHTMLKEEILSIMDRAIYTEIRMNEIDQITSDIEHIAVLMDDEITPFSYVTAESYSRDLSLLQNQAARNFNWYYIPVFVQIASAHLTMKNYLVPHSFKISPECGWRRLESYYAAKAIALEDFNALIDTYATIEQEWIETETEGPTEYCERHQCSARGNNGDGGQCARNFNLHNRQPSYCIYKYRWRDHNHNYHSGFATITLAREHQENFFANHMSNQDEVLSSEIIDFRNELLRDDAEDLESCGVIGEISKVCSCLTGRPYCNMGQQICVKEIQSEANDYNCPISYGRFAEPTLNFASFGGMSYSTVPNNEIYLGVIDEPGENYEINFIFRGTNYRASHKALFRFTNREVYTNYGTYGDRSPLITWYDGKPLVYVKTQQENFGFGKDLGRIDLYQYISIKVVFLEDRVLIYRGDGRWDYHTNDRSNRPLLDRLHVFFGDRFYRNSDSVQVRSLIFRKIMYGNKLIDDNRYRSLDYKIGDFPSLSDSIIGVIASPGSRYQISFTILRTDDTIYTDQEASILCFKCSSFTGYNNYFPYVYSWDGKVSYGIRHDSGTLWGHTHQLLPIGEKTHVKIVDVGGDEIVIYVNGIRYSEDITGRTRQFCPGALLVETGTFGVPTSYEIYNLFYQNLTPL